MELPVVILAGGLGTRLREETDVKPKPMVDVGGHPIIWHIMKHFSTFGCREFVICLGYRGEVIRRYFMEYALQKASMTVDLAENKWTIHGNAVQEDWTVHLLETGAETMTGGRIGRAARFLDGRPFLATYGDGVSDVDVAALVAFHKANGRTATLTAVRPPARFGGLVIEDGQVNEFVEKPQIGEGWINGGFMVLEPEIAELLETDETILEREPLETLAREGRLGAFMHDGFWQCMDTVRDLTYLRELWSGGQAPWKSW